MKHASETEEKPADESLIYTQLYVKEIQVYISLDMYTRDICFKM